MAGSTVENSRAALPTDLATRDARRVALLVPTVALLGGTVAMAISPRFGFFGVALAFGWTQLVGL